MHFPPRRVLLWSFVALGLASVTSRAAAENQVISNLELMERLTAAAATELFKSVPGEVALGHVLLVPYAADEHHEFVDNVLARFLNAAGHKVYGRAGQLTDSLRANVLPDGRMLKLEYRVFTFALSYPKIYRSHLIGGKKVKRSADIKLLGKLVDPSDESLVWIGEASRSHEDQFSHKLLPEVEEGLFAFTKPAQTTTKWGKLVEPVAVTGIIVGLIYLFFSNQDNN
ncbi:MAG: hypothetical protein OEN01_04655 [Candidatus Krumholzibacteria bacterium]|nr:hypothetical protein [Candidatus Krumholzibacteria bacterium]